MTTQKKQRKIHLATCTTKDQNRLMAQARQAHAEGVFQDLSFSGQKFSAAFTKTLQQPGQYLGLKAALNGKIVGFLYLCWATILSPMKAASPV